MSDVETPVDRTSHLAVATAFNDKFDPIVLEKEREALTRIPRQTWAKMEQRKETPPRIQLSPRRHGYRLSDLQKFLLERTAARAP